MWCPTWSTYRPWVCFEVKFVGDILLTQGEPGHFAESRNYPIEYISTHRHFKKLETIHFLELTTVFS